MVSRITKDYVWDETRGRKNHCSFHDQYQPCDEFVWLNTDDPSLFPIKIDQLDVIRRTYRQYGLKEPKDFPKFYNVEGYGLPPEDQVFQREVIPQGIIDIEKKIRNGIKKDKKTKDKSAARKEILVIEGFWDELETNQDKYANEISWLNTMWAYRLLGKFFFCNGKLTYITGAYWQFLNWWYLKGNILPDYRDRDRRRAVSLKYAETTTETFKDIDSETGKPIPNEFGEYDMIDIGKRTMYGCNDTKARRVGDTSWIENECCEYDTRTIEAKHGIQGKDDDNAENVFQEHFVHPFGRYPIFFKPMWDTAAGISPKSGILFDNIDNKGEGLHTEVDFATSASASKYDGTYLHRFHLDEGGKIGKMGSDVNQINDVVKFCLSLGAGSEIHGLVAVTTTVDEIEEKSAGENYMRLCARSHFENRDANGQTDSGLMNVFFKAWDGLQSFIGKYGESIIETPTPEQALFIGRTYGAKEFINRKIKDLRRTKNWEALALFRRQHPVCWLDAFAPPPKAQVFRRDLIEDQIHNLQTHPELQAIRGNFRWVSGFGSDVEWYNDDEGRFYKSKNFAKNETNLKVFRNSVWCPKFTDRYVSSPDTFGINKPTGRASKGGIVIRWRRDFQVDKQGKQDDLQSDRVVLTYSFRPDTVSLYCEDVLMSALYCGAMIYPERNKTNVIDYCRSHGYEGFLMYDVDRLTGKRKNEPGWWNKDDLVETAIRWLADEIVHNVDRNYHLDLLQQYLEMGGREYITNLDLIASDLGTMIAEHSTYFSMIKNITDHIDCTGFVPGYSL